MGCELPVFVITANISAVSSDPVFPDTALKGLTALLQNDAFKNGVLAAASTTYGTVRWYAGKYSAFRLADS